MKIQPASNSVASISDRFGRRFPYLRLSVIEACNYRCSYCLPDGYHARPNKPQELRLDEIARLLKAFTRVGLRKVRLTGGEPSVRRDLAAIIEIAAQTGGIEKIALTTNGSVLARKLEEWVNAGLTHLNISVDALERDRFAAITGRDQLPEILKSIERAIHSTALHLKLNAVLLKDLNDDQWPLWVDYLRERPITLRFIELMRTGDNADYFAKHHWRADALIEQMRVSGWQELPRALDAGPAREYAHPDFTGRIGIIAPYSKDFCAACNRLRVTAGGDLRTCLFAESGVPLRAHLQRDDQIDELIAVLQRALGIKTIGHELHLHKTGITPHLASVGG